MLVVLLHTSAAYLYNVFDISSFSWNVGNLIDSFTRICIPLFFMISGYLFFGERGPKAKHFLRLIMILLFYSVVALLYVRFCCGVSTLPLIKNIISKPVFFHLWYFYALLPIYIFASFISVRKISFNLAVTLSIICFIVFNPRLSDVANLFNVSYSNMAQIDGNIIYFMLYAVFGAILGRTNAKNRNVVKYSTLVLYFSSALIIAYSTYVLSIEAGELVSRFYDFNGVFVFIGAISIFLFVKEHERMPDFIHKPLVVIGKNSLGIFGFHAIILDFIDRQQYRNFNKPVLDIVIVFLVTMSLSLLTSICIRQLDRNSWVS